jgi:hypothetical protein
VSRLLILSVEIPHNLAIHLGRHQNPLGYTSNSLRPGDGGVGRIGDFRLHATFRTNEVLDKQ